MNKTAIYMVLAFLLVSCQNNVVYQKNIVLDNQEWPRDSIKIFSVNITDTVHPVNIFFNCRISGDYPNSNLFLFITITGPQNLYIRDTLECILANDKGKWLGKGFGGLWSNKIPYKQGVVFPRSGIYSIQLDQATRHVVLPSVNDIGITIEKI